LKKDVYIPYLLDSIPTYDTVFRVTTNSPLLTPIESLKGVGKETANQLARLQLTTVNDMLEFWPREYEDRRNLPTIQAISKTEAIVTLKARIESLSTKQAGNKTHILKAKLADQTGEIEAVWFNQSFLKKVLKPGLTVIVSGKLEWNKFSQGMQLSVQSTDVCYPNQESPSEKIMPIYPLTQGLYQKKIRQVSQNCLSQFNKWIQDPLPEAFRTRFNLISRQEMIENIHFPNDEARFKNAKYRAIFEDLFWFQLPYFIRKTKKQNHLGTGALRTDGPLIKAYLEHLPYVLTNAQKRVINDIKEDAQGRTPMNRLIQGDVGSGKTDVAMVALLMAIESGKKGVLLAPTEILAEQHMIKCQERLAPLGIKTVLLKGKMKAKEKKETLEAIQSEGPLVIVGTHAIIEGPVKIVNLGLVIIDEQHRFGVMQRMKLQKKGDFPHSLFMTATPIPRTLLLACYGDLDQSVIDEMPPGRTPPRTYFGKEDKWDKVMAFCQNQIANTHQVYIVYPLVEESEKIDLRSAVDGWERLQIRFPDIKVGILHGKMKSEEKQDVMSKFRKNEIQILVATTVIEVGVDVPNANTMVIRHAERFGLSQLHQLRGRIGRGPGSCFCFLVADPKTETSNRRIKALLNSSDGFKIAEEDLQIRGPGEMLGTQQAGEIQLKVADLDRDQSVLKEVQKAIQMLLASDPNLTHPDHQAIAIECQTHNRITESVIN
jgi:ATP-dependent DNA helicase RecG